ncbi:MAG: hypothetical protein ABGX16_14595, partial [Pirellulales bacterium]
MRLCSAASASRSPAIHAFLQHEYPDDYAHNPATDWIQGVQIVRVHDVAATRQALSVWEASM